MSEVFIILDYIGTFVFAITGASIAGKSDFDLFGMLFLGFLTAVGGGTVRDLILSVDVFWTTQPMFLYIIFLGCLSTYFLHSFYDKHAGVLLFLDTLGLGLFVSIGTQKALALNHTWETALIMGTISGVLGGILRSAFSREVSILYHRELYATVAAAASICYILSSNYGLDPNLCAFLSISSSFGLRYTAIKFNIRLPKLND